VVPRARLYQHAAGDPAHPGRLPDWLAREVTRIASSRNTPTPTPTRPRLPGTSASGPANYLHTVLDNGAEDLARLSDGRKQALAALAYKAGGYLEYSGLPETEVIDRLVTAGANCGLTHREAERTARRSLENGSRRPLTPQSRNHARPPRR
jgi:hypothetical protein